MKNKIVRKSNALIEASYKLTTQEQRVILFLVSQINSADEDFKDYSIAIKDFSELVGIHSNSQYKDIKQVTKKLISRVFTIQNQGEELQISWLSSAKYITGKGTVVLSFDRKLKPFLLQLKTHFTKYRLHQIMQLKSSFSIRIYELLKQYQKLETRVFEVYLLRERLGIENEQYKNFNDFKRFVILVAQEELAEKTDISFEFEEIKVGRAVGKIRFIIKSHTKQQEQFILPKFEEEKLDPKLSALFDSVPKLYKNKKSIRALVVSAFEKQGFEFVMRNIVYANDRSNAIKPGSNLLKGSNYRNYLAKSLKGDFGLDYQEDTEAERAKEQEIKEKANQEELKQLREKEKINREIELASKAREYMKKLDPAVLKEIESAAISRLPVEIQKMALEKRFTSKVAINRSMERIVIERFLLEKTEEIPLNAAPDT